MRYDACRNVDSGDARQFWEVSRVNSNEARSAWSSLDASRDSFRVYRDYLHGPGSPDWVCIGLERGLQFGEFRGPVVLRPRAQSDYQHDPELSLRRRRTLSYLWFDLGDYLCLCVRAAATRSGLAGGFAVLLVAVSPFDRGVSSQLGRRFLREHSSCRPLARDRQLHLARRVRHGPGIDL